MNSENIIRQYTSIKRLRYYTDYDYYTDNVQTLLDCMIADKRVIGARYIWQRSCWN